MSTSAETQGRGLNRWVASPTVRSIAGVIGLGLLAVLYLSRARYGQGLIWQGMPAWTLRLFWGEPERVALWRSPREILAPRVEYQTPTPRLRYSYYDPPPLWASQAEREAWELRRRVDELEWQLEDLGRALEEAQAAADRAIREAQSRAEPYGRREVWVYGRKGCTVWLDSLSYDLPLRVRTWRCNALRQQPAASSPERDGQDIDVQAIIKFLEEARANLNKDPGSR